MKVEVINYLHSDIVNFIEEKIQSHTYKEGDKLPSERELANEFKVSRSVVREGIQILREKGLIEIHPGRGAFVTKPDPLMVASTMERILQNYETTVEDILEVREDMELIIVVKAVKTASEEQIEELYNLYQLMKENIEDIEYFIELDIKFHNLLAKSTGNILYSILLNSFIDMTNNLLFKLTMYRPETTLIAIDQHLEIIKSLEEENVEKAENVMKAHMQVIRDDIKVLRGKNLL